MSMIQVLRNMKKFLCWYQRRNGEEAILEVPAIVLTLVNILLDVFVPSHQKTIREFHETKLFAPVGEQKAKMRRGLK